MSRLENKVAIVTGGASGIGAAITKMFAREGARVVIGDVQVDLGNSVAHEIGTSGHFLRTDVTSTQEVREMVRGTLDKFGKIDILVNNAGLTITGISIINYSEEDFDRSILVNLKSAWLCTKYAFPSLIETGNGSIINIASIAGVIGNPGQTGFGAAKGGLVQLTRHCATEGARKGIRVNCISPGGIVTPLSFALRPGVAKDVVIKSNAEQNPLRRTGWPDDVAYAALWIASDEARFLTAQNVVLDGGLTMVREKIRDLPTGD